MINNFVQIKKKNKKKKSCMLGTMVLRNNCYTTGGKRGKEQP